MLIWDLRFSQWWRFMSLSWVVTLCCGMVRYQCFGGPSCLYWQGEVKVEAARSSKMFVFCHITLLHHNLEDHDLSISIHHKNKKQEVMHCERVNFWSFLLIINCVIWQFSSCVCISSFSPNLWEDITIDRISVYASAFVLTFSIHQLQICDSLDRPPTWQPSCPPL
jgi:hypothetical protein